MNKSLECYIPDQPRDQSLRLGWGTENLLKWQPVIVSQCMLISDGECDFTLPHSCGLSKYCCCLLFKYEDTDALLSPRICLGKIALSTAFSLSRTCCLSFCWQHALHSYLVSFVGASQGIM